MKKTGVALLMAAACLSVSAQTVRPRTIQGQDFSSTLSTSQRSLYVYSDAKAKALKVATQTLTLDDIKYWAGEGENRAALVIQFGEEGEENAVAFGYRWSGGDTNGEAMLRSIVSSHPQFFAALQYTGTYGYTIAGMGWDTYQNGVSDLMNEKQGAYIDASESDDGLFDISDYTRYDYKNWTAVDTYDIWKAGWGDPYYWSYYVGSSLSTLSYASLGLTSQPVKNGDWNAWIFSEDSSLKTVVSASSAIPADVDASFVYNGLTYAILNYDNKTVAVAGDGTYSYEGDIVIPEKVMNGDVEYTVTEVGAGSFMGCGINSVQLPTTITKISREAFMGSSLTSVNIPSAVKFIGSLAFYGCTDLASITAEGTTPATAKADAFEDVNEEVVLTVPASAVDAYTAATGWNALTATPAETPVTLPTFVDFDKINVWVGEGDKAVALVMNWNDNVGMDNLVLGVKFSDSESLTAKDILTRAANGFARLNYSDSAVSYDLYGDGAINETYDHKASSVNLFVDNGTGLTSTDAAVADKNIVYVTTADVAEYPAYRFYVPKDDEVGVWTLDEISYPILSTLQFPVYLNVGGSGLTCTSISATITNLEGTTDTSVISRLSASPKTGNTMSTLTCVSVGDVLISVRGYINKKYTSYTTPCKVHVIKAANPIESIKITAFDDEPVTIEHLGVLLKNIETSDISITPSDADFKTLTYEVSGDNIHVYNSSTRYFFIGKSVGECQLRFKAKDGSGVVSDPIKFIVTERERAIPDDEYQDGTFILNEDWYGHCPGSINYIDAENNLYPNAYETNNIGMGFGSTSQFATIFGGRLYVSSKQASDKDQNGVASGGRLVIADAKTLKRIASFDDLGKDGRCVAGVSPEKVYFGMSANIRVVNVDNENNTFSLGSTITTGEILAIETAGGHVFAFDKTNKKVLVINPETDEIESTLCTTASALAQTGDGNIWVATTAKELICYNPETLAEIKKVTVPSAISTEAGHPVPLFANINDNILYWTIAPNWTSKAIYRWKLDEDVPASPLCSVSDCYSDFRVDSRSGDIIYTGPNNNVTGNYVQFLDGTDGSAKTKIDLPDNYWFSSMAVFPDKYEPEFSIESIDTALEPMTVDLSEYVTDKDNIDKNITLAMNVVEGSEFADFQLSDKTLSINPVKAGEAHILLTAVSNGRVVNANIPVNVGKKTGVTGVVEAQGSVIVVDNVLTANHYDGTIFGVYDMNGRQVNAFMADGDSFSVNLNLSNGVYVVRSLNGDKALVKKIIIK
jgi:hypothetical protein